MFNHVPVELQTITATNKNGVRLYETPDGNKYHQSQPCYQYGTRRD